MVFYGVVGNMSILASFSVVFLTWVLDCLFASAALMINQDSTSSIPEVVVCTSKGFEFCLSEALNVGMHVNE